METSAGKSSSRVERRERHGNFYILQVVLGAAFILATLFTAWTPSEINRLSPEERLGFDPNAQSTQLAAAGGATPTARQKPRIGIVAGHWGNDSGAVCADGLTEVELNQNIAVLAQRFLVSRGYTVDVLQEFDPLLRGYQASVLVSIHADSCDFINDQATGFKVAAALATSRPEKAARLTACLRNRYAQATGLPIHTTSVTNDMTSYHAFEEIDEGTPAAIIETGFMNLDRQFLEQQPDLAAQGIASGILCYLNNEDISEQSIDTAP